MQASATPLNINTQCVVAGAGPGGSRQGDAAKRSGLPTFVKDIARWPVLARLAGRLVGMGIRREWVRF